MIKKFIIFIVMAFSLIKIDAFEGKGHLLLDSPFPHHKIEVMIEQASEHDSPLLLFLYGASSEKGLHGISKSWFMHWLDKGYTVAAISMPGYGDSTGKKDFCGSFTMASLNFAIDSIKAKLNVSNFGVIGFGQGGLASLLLASQRKDIKCVVCSNGVYDLLRHQVPDDMLMSVLKKEEYDINIEDVEALKVRSPISYISKIDTPLFLLHRKGNPIVSEKEVMDFSQSLISIGRNAI